MLSEALVSDFIGFWLQWVLLVIEEPKSIKSESVLLQEAFSDEEEMYTLIFDMTQAVLSVERPSSFKSIYCGTTSSPLLVNVRTAGYSGKWGRFIRVLLPSSH